MARKVLNWSMKKMAWMNTKILNNRFDALIIIDGNRGLGKSTLAIHLARRVALNFKKMGSKDYKFNWKGSFLYTPKETKSFLNKWRTTGIVDEAINVTFNRDFYSSDNKDIIKLINMNRDHNNLIIMCVPSFATLDSQIKNLCKIRLTVVRRGMAIIQTPNQSIYSRDKWDVSTNEKLEKQWIAKGIRNPHYSKLTTFRGVMKFPALSSSAETKYQATKDAKRNQVAEEQMGIEGEKSNDPYNIAIEKLKSNQIKNMQVLEGMALAIGTKPDTFRRKLSSMLKAEGSNAKVGSYFWEKSKKEIEEIEEKKEKDAMLNSLMDKIK